MKIEIYNKKTNEVIETKEISENKLKAFMYYFLNQADTKVYAYRIV